MQIGKQTKEDYPYRLCLNCNNIFIPFQGGQGFCSKECAREVRRLKLSNPNFRELILEHFNFTCQNCGLRTDKLDIHHIIPLYKGGEDKITNLEPLCLVCHKKKHSYH